ncbi:ABC transporter permease subunit [bacterium]|nr:ABC transporter permease subunit [bacterium]
MFSTLFLKEIRESIMAHWFYMVTLICLILIPFSLYIGTLNYRQSMIDYRESIRLYHDKTDGWVDVDSNVEGFRPPSPLSIFDGGIQNDIPSKVIASPDGVVRMIDEPGVRNPNGSLFGSFDYRFMVSVILSLLSLIFTFNAITGEKESGTFRLIMSNPVPRWVMLSGKLIGRYILFVIPFTIALIAGVILIFVTDSSIIMQSEFLPNIVAIMLISYLFIFAIFSLGIMLSTLTHHSMMTVFVSLFVWIFIVFGIPKLSPMLAQIMYPVRSPQIVNTEKQLVRRTIEKELNERRSQLFETTMRSFGIDDWEKVYRDHNDNGPQIDHEAFREYDAKASALVTEYRERIVDAYASIDRKYTNELNRQSAFAQCLARLSPVSCYSFLVSDLSGTGLEALISFRTAARAFQNRLDNELYRKNVINVYGRHDGPHITSIKGGRIRVPELIQFGYVKAGDVIQTDRIDFLLLILYAILFFTVAFVKFIRYDVR